MKARFAATYFILSLVSVMLFSGGPLWLVSLTVANLCLSVRMMNRHGEEFEK